MFVVDLRRINARATGGSSRGKVFVVTDLFKIKIKLLGNGAVSVILCGQF